MSAVPEIVRKFSDMLATSTQDKLEALAYNSPATHFCLFMEIKDKNGRWIRPKPNVLQLRISETIETIRAKCPGTRIRIIAVKPRRAGLSTFSLHCGYHEAMRRPIEGITIADRRENSQMLIERLGEYSTHDSFPWENRVIRNAQGIFEWDNGSRWTIDSAENPDAGVGGTRHFGHFSECSKYPQTAIKNDVKTMTAALPSFSGSDTICIAESTPEGAAGWFYGTFDEEAMWLDDFLKRYAEGFRPEQQWIKVFAAWWEFDDYRRQNPVSEAERAEIDATLSDLEREEREKFGLTYEQLAWRRETIASECDGDPRIFAYYYPSDPISCWIASGTPRFDMQILADMKKKAKDVTPDTGYLVTQHNGVVTWSRDERGAGEILMFEEPREGMAYIVACDPATGESQTMGADPDRTSIAVWRQKFFDPDLKLARCAKLVARVRPPFTGDDDIAAGHIARLSKFYGGCMIALEVNQGLQVLRCLLDASLPIYKRIVFSHKTNAKEEQYGFKLTDQNQRRMVIDGLAAAIRNREIEPDFHTIEELMKFVRKPNGRYEAASGAHDDDVMQAAMAWEVLPSATVFARKVRRDVDPTDMATGNRKQGWRVVSNVRRGW
ncbi:MAG: hypothetical protein LLG20_22570 [Acidobacteriales bacterium]|nr:hypothetical protein [Terriglobales bacterium]